MHSFPRLGVFESCTRESECSPQACLPPALPCAPHVPSFYSCDVRAYLGRKPRSYPHHRSLALHRSSPSASFLPRGRLPHASLTSNCRCNCASITVHPLTETSQPTYCPNSYSATTPMTIRTNKKISDNQKRAANDRQENTTNWFTRHLRRPVTRQFKEEGYKDDCLAEEILPPRPQTAPSTAMHDGLQASWIPDARPSPWVEPQLTRPLNKPPPRPPRPDSDVIRDVNAWLDASMIKPAPPLMAGIPYWREGPFSTGSGPSSDVRFAVPILHGPEEHRPAAAATISHGHQLKSFCRRAKKMQVRMPSLLRTKSQRFTVTQRKQSNRRSTSMPLLSKVNEEAITSTPQPLGRARSMMDMTDTGSSSLATTSSRNAGWIRSGRPQYVGQSPRLGCPANPRFDDQESSMERRVNAVFGQASRLGDYMRPPTALHRGGREDSVGELSDAPSYTSGPPPPSYRSRAASVRTTSSFGCVDAMNAARQQQLLAVQTKMTQPEQGVKGKFRKLFTR